jgi:hypothetical protein
MDSLAKNELSQLVRFAEADLHIALNEMRDTLKPDYLLLEQAQIIILMLEDYQQFVIKNGYTEKAKESKKRLLKLLDINGQLSELGTTNNSLQLLNRNLHAQVVAKNNIILEKDKEINRLQQIMNF